LHTWKTILPLVLAALFGAAPATPAADEGVGATSVAEMLQRRQESRLREQLIKEGRWNELRDLDTAQAQRLQIQKEQSLARVNEDLAVSSAVGAPTMDAMGTMCGPPGATTGAAAQGTMQVR
jgi:hypothetical protein